MAAERVVPLEEGDRRVVAQQPRAGQAGASGTDDGDSWGKVGGLRGGILPVYRGCGPVVGCGEGAARGGSPKRRCWGGGEEGGQAIG